MDWVMPTLKWIETTPPAVFISHSSWCFSAMLMVHLAAICVVFGMIAVVDLRLLGLASRNVAVTAICRQALPWTWGAFAVSAATGAVLYLANPIKYFQNAAFQAKFALLALAGINMLVFQLITRRRVAEWDRAAPIPLAARLAGAVSLTSWTAIVGLGRWTAYVML
jgi:Family of unknown function (DUF6644)